MRAKPVLLPPPNAVRNPNVTTRALSVLYSAASVSDRSALETFGRDGWRTSRTNWRRASSLFVMNLRVRRVMGAEGSAYKETKNQSSEIQSLHPAHSEAACVL